MADVEYADGAEDAVLSALRAAADVGAGSAELSALADTPELAYHFSPARLGLLAPLRVRPGMRVLDLGCGSGVFARALAEDGARVLGIEAMPLRAAAARERCRDLPEVQIRTAGIEESLDALAAEGARFDLVLLCGVLEYGPAYGVPPEWMLAGVAEVLAGGGVLALAIENRLGLGYLLGRDEDHLARPWAGVIGYPRAPGQRTPRTWTRSGLSVLLAGAGLSARRWLLPYPDYKLPRAILDESLFDREDSPSLVDKLVRDPVQGAFGGNRSAVPVRAAHRAVLAEGGGVATAPAFLVLAGRTPDAVRAASRPGLGWLVTNYRLPGWRRSRELIAGPGDELSLRHLNGAENSAGWLRQHLADTEPVLPGAALDSELAAALADGDLDGATRLLLTWRRVSEVDARPLREDDLRHPFLPGVPGVPVLPPDCLDVHPGNVILTGEGPVRIDREWHAGTGVDAELALLRGLWEFTREIHVAGEPHPWPEEHTGHQLLVELAGLAGLRDAVDHRFDELLDAEVAVQELVTGAPAERVRTALRARADQPGEPRLWERSAPGGPRAALAASMTALSANRELRAEVERRGRRADELDQAVRAQHDRAEELTAELDRVGTELADTHRALGEREQAAEELRREKTELDNRLGVALETLARTEGRYDADLTDAASRLAAAEERLRNLTAELTSVRAQLDRAHRIPGLRRALAGAATGSLQHEIVLPTETVYCGRSQTVELAGWVAHTGARVRSARVLADGRPHRAKIGWPRADVAKTLATMGIRVQDDCGLSVRIWLPTVTEPGTVTLELDVELDNGKRVTAPLGDIRVAPGAELRPLPVRWPSAGPRVAICLSTYEPDADFLRQQLESIRAQTHRNWVCVVCDDGSSRAGRAVVTDAVSDDPRFVLVENANNVGYYRNFERALARIPEDTEFVALSDQDDVWEPHKLAKMLREFDDPAVTLAYSDMRLIDDVGDTIAETAWPPGRNQYTDLPSLIVKNTVTGAACVLRAELVRERALPFPEPTEALFHDHWLAVSALAAGRIAFVEEPLTRYRQHGENVTGWQLPNLDVGLPGVRALPALLARTPAARRWAASLPPGRRTEFGHVAQHALDRVSQFAGLLLTRNADVLPEPVARDLRKLAVADRRIAPLLELALRAHRDGRRYTGGEERRMLISALYARLRKR